MTNPINPRDAESRLVRALGVGGLTASVVNSTIGAGIFVLPAIVASQLGAAGAVGYVVCAVAMFLIVLCFAEAGSRVSLSGGLYGYVETAFGGFTGFIAGILLWITGVLASASVANVFATGLQTLVPGLGGSLARGLLIAGTYAGLAWVNVRGVKFGTRFVQAATVGKLLPLMFVIIAGMFFIVPEKLTWPGLPPIDVIGRSAIILIFAFFGVEVALAPSGEVRNPSRTVPRALLLAMAGVTVIYIALQTVAQGILGAELALNRDAPLAAVAQAIIGDGGRLLVLVGTVISTFGYLSGDMLGSPRALFALGTRGLLPTALGRVHDVHRSPYISIVTHGALAAILAISGSFEKLVVVSSVAALSLYFLCCVSTIQLRRKNIRMEGAMAFALPGGPVVPLLACAIILWLLFQAKASEFAGVAILIVIASVYYILSRARAGRAAAR